MYVSQHRVAGHHYTVAGRRPRQSIRIVVSVYIRIHTRYTALHNESKIVQINRVPSTGEICWLRTFLSYFWICQMTGKGKTIIEFSLFISFISAATDRRPLVSLNPFRNSQKKKDKTDKKICKWMDRFNRRKMFYLRADAGHAFLHFWGFSSFLFRQKKAMPPPPPKQMKKKTQNTNHSQILRIPLLCGLSSVVSTLNLRYFGRIKTFWFATKQEKKIACEITRATNKGKY